MYFVLIIAIVALDQIIKAIVRTGLSLNESIPVFGDFLSITLHFNTGAAFSMMQGYRLLLTVLPSVMVILIIAYIIKNRRNSKRFLLVSLSLIAGGGVGNIIDRFLAGQVTDYISVGNFPVFNLADMCVVLGCIFVAVFILFFDGKKRSKLRDDKTEIRG